MDTYDKNPNSSDSQNNVLFISEEARDTAEKLAERWKREYHRWKRSAMISIVATIATLMGTAYYTAFHIPRANIPDYCPNKEALSSPFDYYSHSRNEALTVYQSADHHSIDRCAWIPYDELLEMQWKAGRASRDKPVN